MDEEIAAVREALAGLNRALSQIAAKGVTAEVASIEARAISDPAPHPIVTIHLTKVRTEIDVQL